MSAERKQHSLLSFSYFSDINSRVFDFYRSPEAEREPYLTLHETEYAEEYREKELKDAYEV